MTLTVTFILKIAILDFVVVRGIVYYKHILLQIDVTPALHEKTLRGAQRYLAGKDIISSLFDEAQLTVFKELLPYWAGFKKTFQKPEDPNKRPGMLWIASVFFPLNCVNSGQVNSYDPIFGEL